MSWFRKFPAIAFALLLGCLSIAAKKEDNAKPAQDKNAKADAKSAKDKDAASPSAADDGNSRIQVPVPPGHDAKGLVIPVRDGLGRMQMRFTMEIGMRTDVDHMNMKTLLIETFDDDEKPEMTINLPQSILDLNTRILSTESGVLIKRADFELTGQSMEFNTGTRAGHVVGKVHMLIYNLENDTNPDAEETPREK